MSVNGISPTSINSYDSPFADRRQKLEALRDALASGDLQAAQSAFAALNVPPTSDASAATSGRSEGNPQVITDLQALGQALDAGNIDAAKQAFAAMRQHRHHGGHHHGSPRADTSITGPDVKTSGDSVGTSLNVIA
jgi:hypothetical protein